jgi:hypothetical protein
MGVFSWSSVFSRYSVKILYGKAAGKSRRKIQVGEMS